MTYPYYGPQDDERHEQQWIAYHLANELIESQIISDFMWSSVGDREFNPSDRPRA